MLQKHGNQYAGVLGAGLSSVAVLLVASLAILATAGHAEEPAEKIPTTEPELADQKDLMSEKLSYSQQILAGLVRGDFDTIADASDELNQLTHLPQWDRFLDDPVYSHFTVEFQRKAQRLATQARAKNLDGSAYSAQLLTATCIACHQHVRDVKAMPASEVSPAQRGQER